MAKIQYVEELEFEDEFAFTPRVVTMAKREKQREDTFEPQKPKSKKPVRHEKPAEDVWADAAAEVSFVRRSNFR